MKNTLLLLLLRLLNNWCLKGYSERVRAALLFRKTMMIYLLKFPHVIDAKSLRERIQMRCVWRVYKIELKRSLVSTSYFLELAFLLKNTSGTKELLLTASSGHALFLHNNNQSSLENDVFSRLHGNPEICLQDHAVVDSDELKFNLFSVSQICDKKNSVPFTDTECLILSPSFKLLDESQVVLRAPRQNDVYSLDLKNIVPSGGITCLYANATSDESKLWHRRLGHMNFKNINKLVKGHLVRGLPSKVFVNDHTCVACKKGKQHKASCKAKLDRTIRKPLELLHMDLFGPVSVERLENQLSHKVKIIRCDHGTEFKNYAMNEFCAKKRIKREFSVAITPQQNKAVNTACYVLNRVLVTKPQNKTPYELLIGKPPSISFMRPFGCPLTILNTLDPLGKFDGKSDEGYLLGYSTTSKAFRVYNKRTKRVEENLHIDFLEYQPNVAGSSCLMRCLIDFLTNTMNYIPVSVENQITVDAGTQESYVAGSSGKDKEPTQEYILLPLHPHRPRIPVEDVIQDAQEKSSENAPNDKGELDSEDIAAEQALKDDLERMVAQEMAAQVVDDATRKAFEEDKRKSASTKRAAQATLSLTNLYGQIPIDASTLPNADLPTDPNMPDLEDVSNAFPNDGIFSGAYDDDDVGAEADFNNMDNTIDVSPIPTLRVHKDHPKGQILGDPKSAVQTRGKIQKASSVQQALVSYIYNQNRTNHKDHQNCLFACFLSQEEPKNISQALQDESWVEAMQEELLQFKLQKVWVLVDLPYGKKVIGTKWVFRNKRDERSIVVKNKARLVAQGFRQEEGIDYDEVFAPVAMIEAIRLFLAFASYMGFTVYQTDVKSAFLYGTIGEEVYVQQPPGFFDHAYPNKVYKVIKALYGLYQAPRAWYKTLSTFLLENGFRRGTIDKTLFIMKNKSDIMLVQVQQQPDGIFISLDKYVAGILKKFDFCSIRTATTPIESNKPLVQDEDGVDVDVHVYRSMIGSLMYLTASRPDIMFVVCACARSFLQLSWICCVADKEGKLKENQGCRVDTDQVHQNGDLKNRSV
ncbi:putative ribonuclease H-like domain-containing protein [Tanacetum coccineum]|uniref:Ribonuclease H-like domain-containing protein n=1 Tax=Tanacetum coccineum TaxID=301880 RepID=A0ABQ5FM98_9ASTR